jgi:hypothetical protein
MKATVISPKISWPEYSFHVPASSGVFLPEPARNFLPALRDVHRGAAAAAPHPPWRQRTLPKKFLKTCEFTQNFNFKERYTVKLNEFHRLNAIALV